MLLAHVHGVMKDGRGGPEARRVVVLSTRRVTACVTMGAYWALLVFAIGGVDFVIPKSQILSYIMPCMPTPTSVLNALRDFDFDLTMGQ